MRAVFIMHCRYINSEYISIYIKYKSDVWCPFLNIVILFYILSTVNRLTE